VDRDRNDRPQVVTYRIPQIEVYQVTDDELKRLEDGCTQVGQDFSFSVACFSFFVAFLIALLSATFESVVRVIFIALDIIFGLAGAYTGLRWWLSRKRAPDVITKIRSRRVEPEVRGGDAPGAG